jgi:subfamily B ATP-binding cassette protein MsbA
MEYEGKVFANLKRFLPFLRPQIKRFLFAGTLMLVSVLLTLPLPLITRYIIDNVLPHKKIVVLNLLIFSLAGFMLMKGISELLNVYFLSQFRAKVIFDIQIKLFQHVQKLGLSYFKNIKTGYLMSRLSNDVSNLQSLLAGTLLEFLKDGMTFIVGVIIIFIFHWKLALASLITLPLFIYSIHFFSGKIRKKSREIQERIAFVLETLQESLSAIMIVKSFQLEKHETTRLLKRLKDVIKNQIKFNLLTSISSYTTAFIGGIGTLIVLWYGGREIAKGTLTLGTFVAFGAFLANIFGPVQRLMNLNTNVQTSIASLERVFQLFDIIPDIIEPYEPKKFETINGLVEFSEITFYYCSPEPILKNINLIIEPRSIVALVGKSGSGKTTLANLLPRFYDPQQGNIFVDKINIREVRIRDLRKIIGIVPQEPFLFSGSIKDNIKLGKLSASDEEIFEAAKLANADLFIKEFPRGYDTEVGERGAKLSGGQRQMISIARAVIKKPKILILDEATSELDAESERLIQDALLRIWKDRTTFIIAHRFSTILNADKIVVMNNGNILDQGKHYELYRRCEYYRKLCLDQFISQDFAENRNNELLNLNYDNLPRESTYSHNQYELDLYHE